MCPCRCPHRGRRACLALCAVLCLAGHAWAQKKRPAAADHPTGPTLDMPAPLGVQRGTTLELVLTGSNLAQPTQLWTSFPAKITIPTENNNGKEDGRLRVRLEVPGDAPVGFHGLRLATKRGLSNLRLFCVDDLPQVLQKDGNQAASSAQSVPVPAVVVGRVRQEASDYYKVRVRAGQRVSFEVLGRRLGSALDPQITLRDPRTQEELPGGHSDDAPGLQTDPRLTHTFKEAGDCLIEVRDATRRGGADAWYRLRIGDFPCATTALPMAARRGTRATVTFAGPTLDGVAPTEVDVPADPAVDAVWVPVRGANGLHGWPVVLGASDWEELSEKEPYLDSGKPNRIPVPGGITGRFPQTGETHYFAFTARKGQRYTIQACTHEFGSPTEVYLTLKDSKGGKVAEVNPQAAPPADQRIDFTAAADGVLTLAVEHLTQWGGPSESYRITVSPSGPGFTLALAADRCDVPQGGSTALKLLATRNDYPGPIELSVVGPPGLSGHTVLSASQPAKAGPLAATLPVSAAADLPPGVYQIAVRGQALIDGKPVVSYASVRAPVSQALADLPYPPLPLLTQVGVAVLDKK